MSDTNDVSETNVSRANEDDRSRDVGDEIERLGRTFEVLELVRRTEPPRALALVMLGRAYAVCREHIRLDVYDYVLDEFTAHHTNNDFIAYVDVEVGFVVRARFVLVASRAFEFVGVEDY